MPDSNAHEVHHNFVQALGRLRRAEQSAVTLFAQVWRDKLFRQLGYATIELYGTEGAGMSLAKTRQLIRLVQTLDDLPATREALDEGRLTWTKARTITRVATPRTEQDWVQAAAKATSRELETKVSRTRVRNRQERDRLRRHRGQAAMVLESESCVQPQPAEVPVQVSITLTPVQHARYEALLEKLRQQGHQSTKAELVLEGLGALTENPETRDTGVSPCQIIAYQCDTCNTTTINQRPIAAAAAEALSCDSIRVSADPAVPNRATVPPSIRRAVLARDRHCCSTTGCSATRFLEVHHRTPRAAGGSNDLENLTTLCGACHRFAHERQPR